MYVCIYIYISMEPPMQFKEQINELTQRYNIIVGEIVKTYPSYKIHSKIKKNSIKIFNKEINNYGIGKEKSPVLILFWK